MFLARREHKMNRHGAKDAKENRIMRTTETLDTMRLAMRDNERANARGIESGETQCRRFAKGGTQRRVGMENREEQS